MCPYRLSEIEGLKIDLKNVQTNIVVIDITETKKSVAQLLKDLKEKGVLLVPFGENRIRGVTHLDVKREDILEAVEKFKYVLQK